MGIASGFVLLPERALSAGLRTDAPNLRQASPADRGCGKLAESGRGGVPHPYIRLTRPISSIVFPVALTPRMSGGGYRDISHRAAGRSSQWFDAADAGPFPRLKSSIR